MTAYEILLILDPELAEERQNEIVARMRELIEKRGGTWRSGTSRGAAASSRTRSTRRREGSYHLLLFDSDAETLAEVTRVLKITDGALAAHGGPPRPRPAGRGRTDSRPTRPE